MCDFVGECSFFLPFLCCVVVCGVFWGFFFWGGGVCGGVGVGGDWVKYFSLNLVTKIKIKTWMGFSIPKLNEALSHC